MADWLEYITSDTNSTLAQLRRKNGRDKPWRLSYLGVGNETWGCGGNMRPEFYADVFRQFQSFVRTPHDNTPVKVASGANAADYKWTEVLMSQAAEQMDAISVHYYTLPTGVWKHKGAATGFNEDEWASTLSRALFMDELVTKNAQIMDRYDPQKRVALFVDEWGTWYDAEPGTNPAFLYQQNSLRDAVVAALTLDIFHRHADRVRMANIAQMVNVLQAMILTEKDKMVLTPTYHVFEMYVPFQDSTSLPAEVTAPSYEHGSSKMAAVDVSAARGTDGLLHLALVNVDPTHPATVTVDITGVTPRGASGQVLTGKALDAHNTFDHPNTIQPVAFKGTRKGKGLVFELPAKSVAVVTVQQ
jgi:alpha-N-arabinofuranosidase